MENIFNKTNAPYLVSGALAIGTLLTSGIFAVAPYVGFLAPVAALSLGLPFIVGGAIFSAVAIALSAVAISKNNTNTISQQEKFESRIAQRKEEEAKARAELKAEGKLPDVIALSYKLSSVPDVIALPYKNAEVSSPENQPTTKGEAQPDQREAEILSTANEPAKEENGQSWTTWGLDKAKTAARLAVGTAIFAAAAAPNLVGTLFTGSNVSPVGGMFNDINGTCSRY